MTTRRAASGLAVVLMATAIAVAQPQSHPEHDLRTYPVVYAVAGVDAVQVRKNVPFKKVGETELTMDIYAAKGDSRARRGAVIFVNGVGDHHGGRLKEWAQYTSWPRLVAACGLIGVTFDARPDPDNLADVRAVLQHLRDEGKSYGIDTDRLALWACSANVGSAAAVLAAEDRPRLRAAVLYYGASEMVRYPADVPALVVRARKDRAQLNTRLDQMMQAALAQRSPWTLVDVDGHHAFDSLDDQDSSRAVIRTTLEFLAKQLASPSAPATCPPEVAVVGGPPAAARLAMAAYFGGEWAAAAEAYSRWSEDHLDDVEALRRLAHAQFELARYPSARSTLERVLAIDPGLVRAHVLMGRVDVAEHRGDAAMQRFAHALELDPNDVEARFELGKAQLAAGQHAEAVESLEAVVKEDPGNGYAWHHLALACLKVGEPERAIEAFEQVLRWSPNDPDLLYNLACAYALSGDRERALQTLERAVTNGYRNRMATLRDPDLDSVQADPRFAKLIERMK